MPSAGESEFGPAARDSGSGLSFLVAFIPDLSPAHALVVFGYLAVFARPASKFVDLTRCASRIPGSVV
jgi:hypothetical protein